MLLRIRSQNIDAEQVHSRDDEFEVKTALFGLQPFLAPDYSSIKTFQSGFLRKHIRRIEHMFRLTVGIKN